MAKKGGGPSVSGNKDLSPVVSEQNFSGYQTMPAKMPQRVSPTGGAPVVNGSGRKAAGSTHKTQAASYPKGSDGKPGGAAVTNVSKKKR